MKAKVFLLNSLYFTLVFFAALALATLALNRKVNSYQQTREPLFFSVDKEDIVINTPVGGRVEEISVTTGQHVRQGTVLAKLVDDAVLSKIQALENVSEDNLSARTEIALLRSQQEQYVIRAPKDGVVYRISATAGSYLGTGTPLITMFADERVKLTGTVNQIQYADIATSKELDVFSQRFGQIYRVALEGVGKVQAVEGYKSSQYEMIFKFADPDEGAAFLEGESLEVVAKKRDDDIQRPADRIVAFWNRFIIGR